MINTMWVSSKEFNFEHEVLIVVGIYIPHCVLSIGDVLFLINSCQSEKWIVLACLIFC